jgi:membrane protein DedA with SNARE-associated domain
VLTTLLDTVGSWPAAAALTVGAVVLFLETGMILGVLLPGTTTVVVLGLWSTAAGTTAVLPIAVAAPASAAGALLGWSRGHRRQAVAPAGHGRLRARVDPVVRQARRWLAAQGPLGAGLLVVGSHWVAGTRTLTPRVAGGAGVPLRLAGPAIVVSATAWASTVVLLSRAVGIRVAGDVGRGSVVVLAVLLVLAGVRSWLHHRWTA